MSKTRNEKLNEHWKPQYLFLGTTKFDFIGKLENIEQDFAYIRKELNLPLTLPLTNRNKYTSNLVNPFKVHWSNLYANELKTLNEYPSYINFYTKELIELVSNRYQKDIKIFGYDFD